jgi:hypothetical protein
MMSSAVAKNIPAFTTRLFMNCVGIFLVKLRKLNYRMPSPDGSGIAAQKKRENPDYFLRGI